MRFFVRPLLLSLGVISLVVAGSTTALGQAENLKQYRLEPATPPSADSFGKMLAMRDNKLRVTGPDLAKNREVFKQQAQSLVYKVTDEQLYAFTDTGELAARPPILTVDYHLNELAKNLLIPTAATRYTIEQGEYIKEFGAALDQAIQDVLKKNPPAIIRVNAARALAIAARSGAPAHVKTIQALLTDKFYTIDKKPLKTYPEVYYYALVAAEGAIAAYDPVAFNLPGQPPKHSIPELDLITLVTTLESLVLKGPDVAHLAAPLDADQSSTEKIVPKKDDGKAPTAPAPATLPGPEGKIASTTMTSEQINLVRYYRRAAVRALTKLRFPEFGGSPDVPLIRPAITIAKVAVNDASLSLPATPVEVAEAIIGLAGMIPSDTFNQAEWLYVIARGSYMVASVKTGNADDKSIPWKTTGARFLQAMDGLKDASGRVPRLRTNQKAILDLVNILNPTVFAPMEKGNPASGPINLDPLNTYLQTVPANRNLFTSVPSTVNPR